MLIQQRVVCHLRLKFVNLVLQHRLLGLHRSQRIIIFVKLVVVIFVDFSIEFKVCDVIERVLEELIGHICFLRPTEPRLLHHVVSDSVDSLDLGGYMLTASEVLLAH